MPVWNLHNPFDPISYEFQALTANVSTASAVQVEKELDAPVSTASALVANVERAAAVARATLAANALIANVSAE